MDKKNSRLSERFFKKWAKIYVDQYEESPDSAKSWAMRTFTKEEDVRDLIEYIDAEFVERGYVKK